MLKTMSAKERLGHYKARNHRVIQSFTREAARKIPYDQQLGRHSESGGTGNSDRDA